MNGVENSIMVQKWELENVSASGGWSGKCRYGNAGTSGLVGKCRYGTEKSIAFLKSHC